MRIARDSHMTLLHDLEFGPATVSLPLSNLSGPEVRI